MNVPGHPPPPPRVESPEVRRCGPGECLAFALGRHFRVGALPAEAEVGISVSRLLDAMPDLRLEEGFTPVERGLFTPGPVSVPVRFTPVRGGYAPSTT